MPELAFAVEGVDVVPFAAEPQVAFKLRIDSLPGDQAIHTIALRCQIQLEATRRHYSADEQRRLLELFGEPDRWSRTLRPLLWTHAQTVVPRFVGTTTRDLHVPCTFDFNVGATKYFGGLDGGEIPLNFLFSGTVFYEGTDAQLQVTQISWGNDVRYRLPVRVWAEMMDHYYPNSGWLRIRRDLIQKLADHKRRHGYGTWDQTLEQLLDDVSEVVPR